MNLVGADTVIFYDSDWNPAMDAQAQDRAHRIGQTRNVHIYRFITEHTIEENMLKKANQKRYLDNLVFLLVVNFVGYSEGTVYNRFLS
jgi:SNF2 family DNA or RNA helicase